MVLWILSSTILLTYAAFRDRIEDDRIFGIKKYATNILVGGWVGYFAIFFFLIMEGLFFIPEAWGNFDEDGEWVSTRHEIAGVVAFIITLVLFSNYKKVIKYLRERIKGIFSKNWGNKIN
jgi:hypothetical protein